MSSAQEPLDDVLENNSYDSKKRDWASHYKRIGFYGAVTADKNSSTSLSDIIKSQIDSINSYIEQLDKRVTEYETMINEKILSNVSEIHNKLDEIKSLKDTLEDIKKERLEIVDQIKISQGELKQLYINIGSQKERLIAKRIEEIGKEVNALVNQQGEFLEKKQSEYTNQFNLNKKRLEDLVSFYQKLLARYFQSYEKAHNKFEQLKNLGINSTVSNVLVYVGFCMAIGASWFFAISAVEFKLSTSSKEFFFFKGILNFGINFIDHYFYESLFLLYLVILIILGVFLYIINKQIKNYIKKIINQDDISLDRFSEKIIDGLAFFKKFWLKIFPTYAVLGFLYVMIIYGYGRTNELREELNSLDISLAALTIGWVICLGGEGIAFLYVTYIIEPRVERSGQYRLRNYIELIIALLLFFSATMGILFFIFLPSSMNLSDKGFTTFLLFMFLGPMSSIVLAYGLRFKGILFSLEETEYKLTILQNLIKRHSGPKIASWQDKELKKIFDINAEMLDIVKAKSRMIAKQDDWDKVKSSQQIGRELKRDVDTWFKRLINVFKKNDSAQNAEDINDFKIERLNEVDKHLVPELSYQFTVEQIKLEELQSKLKIIVDKERAINENEYPTIVKVNKEIRDLKNEIDDYKNRIFVYKRKHVFLVDNIKEYHVIQAKYHIEEGYMTGTWYIKNNTMK